jgi:cytochrome c oxidase assembly factor CtaG
VVAPLLLSLAWFLAGALMALARGPWYAAYAALGMTPFGLTPLQDQQLAGLLMWVPGGLVHAGAALWLLARALRTEPEVPHAA